MKEKQVFVICTPEEIVLTVQLDFLFIETLSVSILGLSYNVQFLLTRE